MGCMGAAVVAAALSGGCWAYSGLRSRVEGKRFKAWRFEPCTETCHHNSCSPASTQLPLPRPPPGPRAAAALTSSRRAGCPQRPQVAHHRLGVGVGCVVHHQAAVVGQLGVARHVKHDLATAGRGEGPRVETVLTKTLARTPHPVNWIPWPRAASPSPPRTCPSPSSLLCSSAPAAAAAPACSCPGTAPPAAPRPRRV